jgi:hypothetical protein
VKGSTNDLSFPHLCEGMLCGGRNPDAWIPAFAGKILLGNLFVDPKNWESYACVIQLRLRCSRIVKFTVRSRKFYEFGAYGRQRFANFRGRPIGKCGSNLKREMVVNPHLLEQSTVLTT